MPHFSTTTATNKTILTPTPTILTETFITTTYTITLHHLNSSPFSLHRKLTHTPPSVERYRHLKPSQRSCPTWLAPPHHPAAASRLIGLGHTAPQWRAGDGGR
ncbi:hypothetical protein E2C01_049718 [Portunus trituberculatus]|uniref:Uncharacterized protein n=1 Tax=Portunus trituberculatus TaxID=210409 RepID=A0A5B7GGU4_PORTR|nr:hypothetical protein [Portunus trituberculatus]